MLVLKLLEGYDFFMILIFRKASKESRESILLRTYICTDCSLWFIANRTQRDRTQRDRTQRSQSHKKKENFSNHVIRDFSPKLNCDIFDYLKNESDFRKKLEKK